MKREMKKEKKKKTPKRTRIIIGVVVVAAIITAIVISAQVQAARTEMERNQSTETIRLEKSDITRTVSVSGVIESAQVKNIYTTQSYPVKEIFVEVGDSVKAGDVLAELDMSRLENDISQTEINLRSAIASAEEELRSNNNSITNARTSLESSQLSLARQKLNTSNAEKDLKEAEEKVSEEFDSYTYDNAIKDTRLSLERKTEDLEKAQDDLDDAINDFDDYNLQNAITDAKNNLDRRKDELTEAEKASNREQNTTSVNLSGYNSAVRAAQTMLAIKEQALENAEKNLKNAIETNDEAAIAAAQVLKETAEQERDAAKAALASANADLNNAIRVGNSADSAESRVTSALYALKDAQNTYDRTITNLERAKKDAVDVANDSLTRAQNAFDDAQRAYEKALEDKIRAIDNNADNKESTLENAQKVYQDSQRQLDSSENSVKSAQNTLDQAQNRPASQGASVEIQELNLDRLNKQLEEGKIVATADGVITEVNIKVGAVPNGIIFVIEDTENLRVSARVREHSISSVILGQDAVITSDATGEKEYDGTVAYISPRAVSAAGSTSVEFEVQANLTQPDTAIKIGMNAFLSIIIEEKPNVYAVPNSVIVSNEKGNFVYALEDGQRREIPVTLGIKTMVNTEVSGGGLSDGIELLMDPEGLLANPNDLGFRDMWRR